MTVFGSILQKFAEKSPVTVMVQGLLERLFNAEKIDTWFESVRDIQYTRTILFSSLVSMMLQVVCRAKDNVYSAYLNSNIDASRQAVYDKLKNIETKTSRDIVRYTAHESELILREMSGTQPALLPGFKVKYLDGNCIEGTDHRLHVLRKTKAGALPGKSLVVFEPELGIVTDVFPCEDGHAQERSLLPQVIESVKTDDLWIADRHFCTLSVMFEIDQKRAYFILRQHKHVPYKPLSEMVFTGENEKGWVDEQWGELICEHRTIQVRRIMIKLKKATRNGDESLYVLTNIPKDKATAERVADLYSKR